MTRFLSEALGAPEPYFRQTLGRLEASHGHPGTDIKLSTEVNRAAKDKLSQLGLDPNDTTPEELYHVLQQRIKDDDARLTKSLRTQAATHISAEGDVVAGMVHVLKQQPDSKRCFALKTSKLRSLLKQLPPKKAMKALGYRSIDSFLKHEPPIMALSAAWLVEGQGWQKRLLDQYKRLVSADFESRSISIIRPSSSKWQELSSKVVDQNKHNILGFEELGALILLPLPKTLPEGSVTVSLTLALHELNEIRAASTYLQLCQVRPDFGQMVRLVATDEPRLSSEVLDQQVPWHIVQRYYAKLKDYLGQTVFEPHLQLDDIAWHDIEQTLSRIEPSMTFWQGSSHVGVLHNGQPVSLNIVDAAINQCNHLSFDQRLSQYFQRSLWHELVLRYLKRDVVEQAVLSELQPQLATETVEV